MWLADQPGEIQFHWDGLSMYKVKIHGQEVARFTNVRIRPINIHTARKVALRWWAKNQATVLAKTVTPKP